MSQAQPGQTPSYVVRQDAGGELKLLLVRDPRATHVAAKISPVKKHPPTISQAEPLTSRLSTSSAPSSSTSSSAPAAQQSSVPRKVKTAVIHTAAAAPASRSGVGALSPEALTQAANEALVNLVKMSAAQGSATTVTAAVGKKGDGMRVKGGKIVKLQQQSRPTQIVVPQKSSSKSPLTAPQDTSPHSTVSHSHTGTKPRHSGGTQSHSKVPKLVPKRATASPKHQALLPVSRIRTIMRTNVQSTHNTHNVSQDSVALITKATELFIAQLAKEAHKISMAAATRDVSYGHLAKSIRKMKQTAFLHDILPEKVLVSDYLASLGNHTDPTHNASTSSSH